MDSMTDDVVVVGGRCAGAPAAMLLARAGLSVRLLERSARLGDVVSGHLIKPTGVARLRRWNLLDAVLATGCPALDDRVLWLGGQPHRPPAPQPGPGPIAPRHRLAGYFVFTAEQEGRGHWSSKHCRDTLHVQNLRRPDRLGRGDGVSFR